MDLGVLYNGLKALTKRGNNGRYLVEPDGNALAIWIDENSTNLQLRFVKVRRQDLPSLDHDGTLEQLQVAEQDGIAEATHMVFFPNNVVGADYNHHGPRVSRFRFYVGVKLVDLDLNLDLMPLIAADVLAKLERFRDIRLFDLKICPSFSESLRSANQDLGAAFAAAGEALSPRSIELSVRFAKATREDAFSRVLPMIRSMLRIPNLRQEALTFRIEGFDTETERVEPIDFLKSQLLQRRSIARASERTRSLDPASAYRQIVEAHNSLKTDIERATSIQL